MASLRSQRTEIPARLPTNGGIVAFLGNGVKSEIRVISRGELQISSFPHFARLPPISFVRVMSAP